jgi:hypothetical protein
LGGLDGDDLLNPNPQSARDFVGRLLGEFAPEQPPSGRSPGVRLDALPWVTSEDSLRLDQWPAGWAPTVVGPYAPLSRLVSVTEPCESTLGSILGDRARAPTLANVLLVHDWMMRNIRYVRDHHQYGIEEHWASPDETLGTYAGDCEDHAILFCSLLAGLGVASRLVVMPQHVLAEVAVGPAATVDRQRVESEILGFLDHRSRNMQLEPYQVPYVRGRLLGGWTVREGQPARLSGRLAETLRCDIKDPRTGVRWLEEDGYLWLAVDNPFGTLYPGDLRSHENAENWRDGRWRCPVEHAYPCLPARPTDE